MAPIPKDTKFDKYDFLVIGGGLFACSLETRPVC